MLRPGDTRRACAVLALALFLPACGTPAVDAALVLRQSGEAMAKLKTVKTDLKFGPGAAAFGFTLVSGAGRVRVPDGADISMRVKQSTTVFEFELITITGHSYLHAPLVGWQELTGDRATGLPDLRVLFSKDKGIPAIIPTGKGAKYTVDETVDGKACYRITAKYTADQIAAAISVLTPTGDVEGTLWVDKSDHRIRKAVLSGKLYEPDKMSTLEVHLYDFDAPIDIQKPI
jgi:hypothetical protein